MALQKQAININFSQGLDTKTDDKQVSPGRFLSLENSVFTKAGLLQKRNGFGFEPNLPDNTSTFLTTFKGNLTAIGTSLNALSAGTGSWVNKGSIQPVELSVLSAISNNTNQSQADSALASNGLVCVVYTDNIPSGMSTTPVYKYVILDSVTGQNVVAPTVITVPGGSVVTAPRVFLLGNHFVIVFISNIGGVNHLQYIAVNAVNTNIVIPVTNISTGLTPASTLNFDGVVTNNSLYLAWEGMGSVRITYLTSSLAQSNVVSFLGFTATLMSVTADITTTTPTIYISFYDSGSQNGYTLAVNHLLATVLAPTAIITGIPVVNLTSSANNMLCTVLYEVNNSYSYDSAIRTDFISKKTVTQGGVVSSATTILRSVGLASKAFMVDGVIYFLTIYFSPFQPTYFLSNSSGHIVAKLAYSNGPGYYITGLPNVTVTGETATVTYLRKDQIQAINKNVNVTSVGGIYSQTGINIASFTLTTSDIVSAEIGNDLFITGGFLWQYDGYSPVEQNFFLWPDSVEATTSTMGGSLSAQQYFYQAIYSWTDNQGNVIRSAPSIPITVTTTGTTSSNTINVPTIRLTYKIANPVKIEIYRWSQAQQIFYEITSITNPLLNDPTVDSVSFVDTQSDANILGNNIIYTTGGVIENLAPPATNVITLFNNRLFLVDAEDPNVLWFSKQVIEAVPVEMSDLLTIFVSPTTSAQGSTGPTLAAAPMDDKICLFKRDAIYYVNGIGPDNTGANSQYSDAIFITSTVGCANQHSIVFMPQGLMFQSDKGIWLLDRGLNTTYIGAPVEKFTQSAKVLSAVNVPGTNQVRFTMDSGITLMYDYFYGQWGTFTNIPAISSTLYQNLHTYITDAGQVFQETPGVYIDGSGPVLMQFTTSWLNLAGLQGYERAYFFYLLGTYMSPHKLYVQIGYDYNETPQQALTITPDNSVAPWGGEQLWGSNGPWGGPGSLEQWRVFFQQGKCQAFQISIQELYDTSLTTLPGAGFTLSGLDVIYGGKSSYPRIKSSRYVG